MALSSSAVHLPGELGRTEERPEFRWPPRATSYSLAATKTKSVPVCVSHACPCVCIWTRAHKFLCAHLRACMGVSVCVLFGLRAVCACARLCACAHV
jgi:hypothetical protein